MGQKSRLGHGGSCVLGGRPCGGGLNCPWGAGFLRACRQNCSINHTKVAFRRADSGTRGFLWRESDTRKRAKYLHISYSMIQPSRKILKLLNLVSKLGENVLHRVTFASKSISLARNTSFMDFCNRVINYWTGRTWTEAWIDQAGYFRLKMLRPRISPAHRVFADVEELQSGMMGRSGEGCGNTGQKFLSRCNCSRYSYPPLITPNTATNPLVAPKRQWFFMHNFAIFSQQLIKSCIFLNSFYNLFRLLY